MSATRSLWQLARGLAVFAVRAAGAVAAVWAAGALYFDASPWAAAGFLALVVAGSAVSRRRAWGFLVPWVAFALVLAWWLQLRPSQDRDWAADVSRMPWAEIDGDTVTIHDVRNFDYPAGRDPVGRWETRTVRLDDLDGLDIAINYWGSPWVAHPIVVFRFRNAPPLAFSIETRREKHEEYSALAGFFRNYELIVLAADERDVLGLRAVHRPGEDVYLYAMTVKPAQVRQRFLEYIAAINALRREPRWYNALTSNCTTAIRGMHEGERLPFDRRLLVNGLGDEMLHERGLLVSDGLPFAELKKRAWANPAIRQAYAGRDFSADIRRGRPGFLGPK